MKFSIREVPRSYDDEIDVYMSWKGAHTHGDVSCRGTRVWFHPDSCLIYDLRYRTPAELQENYRKAGEGDFKTADCWRLYGDDANLRAVNIEEIIVKVNGTGAYSFQKSYDELAKEFYNSSYELLEEFIPEESGASYFFEAPDSYIAVFKRDEIVKELQEALKFGRENEVTFHWN